MSALQDRSNESKFQNMAERVETEPNEGTNFSRITAANLVCISFVSIIAAAALLPGIHLVWRLWIGEPAWTAVIFPLACAGTGVLLSLFSGRAPHFSPWRRLITTQLVLTAIAALTPSLIQAVNLFPAWELSYSPSRPASIGILSALGGVWLFIVGMCLLHQIQLVAEVSKLRDISALALTMVLAAVGWFAGLLSLEYLGISGLFYTSAVAGILVLIAAFPSRRLLARVSITRGANGDAAVARDATTSSSTVALLTGIVAAAALQLLSRFLILLTAGEYQGSRYLAVPAMVGSGLMVTAIHLRGSLVRRFALWIGVTHLLFALLLPLALLQTPERWAALMGRDVDQRLFFFCVVVGGAVGICFGLGLSALFDQTKSAATFRALIVGGALGWIVVDWFAIPFIGMQNSLSIVSATAFMVTVVQWMRSSSTLGPKTRIALVAAATVLFAVEAWSMGLVAGFPMIPHRWMPNAANIVESPAGIFATTPMTEGSRLESNGRLVATRFPHRQQGLAVHLAAIRHSAPRDVLLLNVVHGTENALVYGVERVVAVERSQAVAEELMRLAPASSPEKIQVVGTEPRGFLATNPDRFDVIVAGADAMPARGSAYQYSTEFYNAVYDRLRENGIFSQEIPFWNYNVEEFRAIVRTFRECFPESSVWFAGRKLILIGSSKRLSPMSVGELAKRLAESPLKQQLDFSFWAGAKGKFIRPEIIAGTFLGGARDIDRVAEGAVVHSDDLAFLARSRVEDPLQAVDVYGLLNPPASPISEQFTGNSSFIAEAERIRVGNLRYFVAESQAAIAAQEMAAGNLVGAKERLERVCQISPEFAEAFLAKGDVLTFLTETPQALQAYHRAVEIDPEWFVAQTRLANALLRAKRSREAREHFETSIQLNPVDPTTLIGFSWLLSTSQDEKSRDEKLSIQLMERLFSSNFVMQPQVLDVWAAVLANAGRYPQAVKVATAAKQMAETMGDFPLARQIGNRLSMYREDRPYRE